MRDDRRNAMRHVNLNRDELLGIVRKNKEKHIKEYDESVKDYIKAALKLAQDNLAKAKSKDLNEISTIKSLPSKPVSYEDSYTRAIRMLELSVDDVIELEEHIFNQLVLDEWQWKNQFITASAMYKSIS